MGKCGYIEGFCQKLRYKGLWPCMFTKDSGRYVKSQMSCSCSDDSCRGSCSVFAEAPDVFPKEKEWMLEEKEGAC